MSPATPSNSTCPLPPYPSPRSARPRRFASRALSAGASTFVEVKPAALHSVTLNGVALDPSLLEDNRFPLHDLAPANELVVKADMAYSNTGEGLHRFVDPADKETYLYAMTFLDDGERMFACFDQPDLKAPFTFRVTAPEHWTVLSNESGVNVAPGRWEFAETKPLATYFATLVAGPYHSSYRTHDGIRLGIHARRSLGEHLDRHAEELFTVTAQSFDYFHRIFGTRYPFGDKYDQAWVPEFNAGAMENAGCVTARDELIFRSAVTDTERQNRAVTIAHEMAHMWFGDLGHDALVGRPVAERELRRLHGRANGRARDALHRRGDGVHRRREAVGVHRRPAPVHSPDLSRRP